MNLPVLYYLDILLYIGDVSNPFAHGGNFGEHDESSVLAFVGVILDPGGDAHQAPIVIHQTTAAVSLQGTVIFRLYFS